MTKNLYIFKNRMFKTALGLTVALSTLASSAMPALAADVELQGDDSSAKSQSVEVSADISSLYAVTLPAMIELTRQTATLTDENTNTTYEKDGFWYKFQIGAAGKLLSNQKLVSRMNNCTITGKNTGNTVELKAYFFRFISGYEETLDNLEDFNNYNGSPLSPTWTSTEIGSCNYNGTSLTDCSYVYKDFWVGIPEDELSKADIYEGTITVNFALE